MDIFNLIENACGAGIKLISLAGVALVIYLLLQTTWEQFGPDIKEYTSTKWNAFLSSMSKFTFFKWVKSVIEFLSWNGVPWKKGTSQVFTQVDTSTNQAKTYFHMGENQQFVSEGYHVIDEADENSFFRSTGEVVDLRMLMKKHILHTEMI